MTHTYLLERELTLPQPLSKTFSFFSDASNLEALTPKSLRFKILTPPPIVMRAGLLIDYRIRLFGFPMNWRTLIEEWEPERRFVDVQLKGPYKLWRHEHLFEEVEGGTLVRDRVEYQLHGWIFAPLVHAAFVKRQLKTIFDYRQKRMTELL